MVYNMSLYKFFLGYLKFWSNSTGLAEDVVRNPRLKRLKAQMKNYTESILTDDEEIESIDGESDEERW